MMMIASYCIIRPIKRATTLKKGKPEWVRTTGRNTSRIRIVDDPVSVETVVSLGTAFWSSNESLWIVPGTIGPEEL
jgi:hypothetical protein